MIRQKVKSKIKNIPFVKNLIERLSILENQAHENELCIDKLQSELTRLSTELSICKEQSWNALKTVDWVSILAENGAYSFPHYFDDKIITDKSERLAVYTTIIGDYDKLNDPTVVDENCDYYCFTDNKELKSKIWKIVYIDKKDFDEIKNLDLDNRRISRFLKTHPHLILPQYSHTFFLDSNITIIRSIWVWIALYSNGEDLITYKHPHRNCIYKEAEACKILNKDDYTLIDSVVERYKNEGFPAQLGLTMTCVLYRKNTKKMNKFNELWWDEIKNYSKRDQLSFMYLCWKEKFRFDICPLNAFNNDFFAYHEHDGAAK